MAGPVALGLDVGTSGLKAVAVAEDGRVVAEAEASYPLLTPRPGWSEQEPEAWWDAARQAIGEITDRLEQRRVAAVGLSGQMHGLVPLDAEGKVVRPAILWNDQRTGSAVAAIERAVPREEMVARTGNPAITGFQLAKAVWLRDEEPVSFVRSRHFLFPKDYIGYRLTGELYAEPTDASGSNAYNLNDRAWDRDVIAAVGLDPALWPATIASRAVAGTVTREAAALTGLPEGLPVIAGAGDNAAAAYGMGLGAARPRLGNVSIGTSGVIFAPIGEPVPDPRGRAHLFCHADGGFNLLGVTLAAAGSLRWFRDTLAGGLSYDDLMKAAETAAPGAAGVTFKPYLAGERTPHLDASLRGSLHGLSLATGLPEIVRAVLEGVAFSLREALGVMEPLTRLENALLTGGGARSALWARMLADVLQLPLAVAEHATGPSYGAARLALEALGGAGPEPDLSHAAWLEPGDFGPYEEAFLRYLDQGP